MRKINLLENSMHRYHLGEGNVESGSMLLEWVV